MSDDSTTAGPIPPREDATDPHASAEPEESAESSGASQEGGAVEIFAFEEECETSSIGPDEVSEELELSQVVLAVGDRLERRLEVLQSLLERGVRAEATREKVVDRLHAELQEYKQDLLLNTMRPVFIDLIQLHDDIGKVAVLPEGEPDERARRSVGLMIGFQQGIEDILYRQGVEPFTVEGDDFDPRRQRAVATKPTDDPSRAKTVAARLRKGFRAGDRVIRPEIVSVYAV